MKIATWNVNGIRARAAQVCEFLEREKPDVLCLQELKAGIEQVPEQCKTDGYHIYWHGSTLRAYSGVSLHVKKGVAEPAFSHPDFDMESRIVAARSANLVLASVYVPNGGKDYPATSISRAPSATCTRSSGATSSASSPRSARFSKS